MKKEIGGDFKNAVLSYMMKIDPMGNLEYLLEGTPAGTPSFVTIALQAYENLQVKHCILNDLLFLKVNAFMYVTMCLASSGSRGIYAYP